MAGANVLALQRPFPWVNFKVSERLDQDNLSFSAEIAAALQRLLF